MNLFKQSSKQDKTISSNGSISNETISDEDKESIRDFALQQCLKQSGKSTLLKKELENEYSKFENKVKTDKNFQEEHKQQTEEQITKVIGDRESIIKQNTELKGKVIHDLHNEIKKCEEDIREASSNPKKYNITSDPDPSTKTLFYIGCIILAAVGVFLTIFYISATYSAFYKDWDASSSLGITAKILDSDAFLNAWEKGWQAGLFVTASVFIFLGLGVILHMFHKGGGKYKLLKIGTLILVTFTFDCLLAYWIEFSVYEANSTPWTPAFHYSIALKNIQFWIIIFFGFVTYLIWGIVFDLTMGKWEQFSPLLVFARKKEEQIKSLKADLEKHEKTSEGLKQEINDKNTEIAVLENKRDRKVIPYGMFKHIHTAFTVGWMSGINNCALTEEDKDKRISECQVVADDYLNSLNF